MQLEEPYSHLADQAEVFAEFLNWPVLGLQAAAVTLKTDDFAEQSLVLLEDELEVVPVRNHPRVIAIPVCEGIAAVWWVMKPLIFVMASRMCWF